MKPVYVIVGSMLLSAGSALAQQQPPPAGGQPPHHEPAGDPSSGPGRHERGPHDGLPGMHGHGEGMHGGMADPRMHRFELMRGYLDSVHRYAQMAHNPSHAGIAAVVSAADILKPRGADAAIEYFTKTLPEVKSPAVQRAVRLQLVDLYKQAGKQDLALEQLQTLMTAEAEPGSPK